MNEAFLIELIRYAIKYGPEAAIAIAKLIQNGATIDDAIAALEKASTKTAKDYLAEATPDSP